MASVLGNNFINSLKVGRAIDIAKVGRVTFGGKELFGGMTQGVSVSYQRPVQPRIGYNDIWYVFGIPQGMLQVQALWISSKDAAELESLSNNCGIIPSTTIDITLDYCNSGGGTSSEKTSLIMYNGTINNFNIAYQRDAGMVQTSFGMMFIGLEIS